MGFKSNVFFYFLFRWMDVTELVQCNLQIRALTGHTAKGWQAVAIPMAFGNSDMRAGSKVDLLLLGEELCCGISSSPLLLLISLLWYGKVG